MACNTTRTVESKQANRFHPNNHGRGAIVTVETLDTAQASMTERKWTEFVLRCLNAEERSALLFDLGSQGTEIISPTQLRAFFENAPSDLPEKLKHLGFEIIS